MSILLDIASVDAPGSRILSVDGGLLDVASGINLRGYAADPGKCYLHNHVGPLVDRIQLYLLD